MEFKYIIMYGRLDQYPLCFFVAFICHGSLKSGLFISLLMRTSCIFLTVQWEGLLVFFLL